MEEEHGGVHVFLNFGHFSPECTQTWSLGATEGEVWIGNFSVKAWKTTKYKLHKIWHSLKFCKNSGKQAHPGVVFNAYYQEKQTEIGWSQ